MKKQKGQVIVEFALILPLFIIFLFGIIYCGMLFYDYTSLSNIARSAAREAAIVDTFDDYEKERIEKLYSKKMRPLLTSLYSATPHQYGDDEEVCKITVSLDEGEDSGTTNDDSIVVTITMQRNATTSPLLQMMLPENYVIKYIMRRDDQYSSSG